MSGMNNQNGRTLEGLAHLRQSIADILTTPIGSRVMRREYGSRLFELTDKPTNSELVVDLYAATAEALDAWEPRIKLQKVSADIVGPEGRIALSLQAQYLPDGKPITLDGIEI